MKFLVIVCCSLVVAAVATPAAADAADRGLNPLMRGQKQDQRAERAPGRDPEQPAVARRDADAAAKAESGRMSPDERRQLRRDIQDAGKDIYRPVRQGPAGRGRFERR